MKNFSKKCHSDTLSYLIKTIPMELLYLTKRYITGINADSDILNQVIQKINLISFKRDNRKSIAKIITLIKMSEKIVIFEIMHQFKNDNHVIARLPFKNLESYMKTSHRDFIEKLTHEAYIEFEKIIGRYIYSDKALIIPSGNMLTNAIHKPFYRIISTSLNPINFIKEEL